MKTYKLKDTAFVKYKNGTYTEEEWKWLLPAFFIAHPLIKYNPYFEEVGDPYLRPGMTGKDYMPPSEIILIDDYKPDECYYQLSAKALIESSHLRKYIGNVMTKQQWRDVLNGDFLAHSWEKIEPELKYVHHAYLREKSKKSMYVFPDGHCLFYETTEEVWDKVRRYDEIVKEMNDDGFVFQTDTYFKIKEIINK